MLAKEQLQEKEQLFGQLRGRNEDLSASVTTKTSQLAAIKALLEETQSALEQEREKNRSAMVEKERWVWLAAGCGYSCCADLLKMPARAVAYRLKPWTVYKRSWDNSSLLSTKREQLLSKLRYQWCGTPNRLVHWHSTVLEYLNDPLIKQINIESEPILCILVSVSIGYLGIPILINHIFLC